MLWAQSNVFFIIISAVKRLIASKIKVFVYVISGVQTRQEWKRWQTNFFFFLQIYTIHVNDLFQGVNGEFRRKVTSLHPWIYMRVLCIFIMYI